MMKTQYFPFVINETSKVERWWSSTQQVTLVDNIFGVSLPKHNILLVTFTTDSKFKKKEKNEFLWILYNRQSVIWLPSKIV